jgi:transposase
MKRFVEGENRAQSTLFPESLDDYIAEDNPVRVVDVFVDELDLQALDFDGAEPEATGRPGYHPATLLKIYIYGYLNRIQSSRRLERETQRNVELIWLTGRLSPDFKTIADFRKDNGKAIRRVCRDFVVMCRSLGLFSEAIVAVDGSKFKAVNNRDKNFTDRKLEARLQQLEESIGRYLADLDRADRDPTLVTEARVEHLKRKIEMVKAQMQELRAVGEQLKQWQFDKRHIRYIAAEDQYECPAGQRASRRFATVEDGMTIYKYWSSACPTCPLRAKCTDGKHRRITRWEHEQVLEAMQARLDRTPQASRIRRQTVEHTFGTLKFWMGATHFLTRTLPRVSTEMSLHVLAYNLKRAMQVIGIMPLIAAMKT